MELDIVLDAEQLGSRYGFNDGDLIDAALEDLGYDDGEVNRHDVLCHLVAAYLYPLLEGRIGLRRVYSAHNPVRVYSVDGLVDTSDGYSVPDELCGVTVTIGEAELRAAVAAVQAGTDGKQALADCVGSRAADVADAGLEAWVGRHVEITCDLDGDEEPVMGTLVNVDDVAVWITRYDDWDADDLERVPLDIVDAIHIYEMSEAEWLRSCARDENLTETPIDEVPDAVAAHMAPGSACYAAVDSEPSGGVVYDNSSSWGHGLTWIPTGD